MVRPFVIIKNKDQDVKSVVVIFFVNIVDQERNVEIAILFLFVIMVDVRLSWYRSM